MLSTKKQIALAEVLIQDNSIDAVREHLRAQIAELEADAPKQLLGLQSLDIKLRLQRLKKFLSMIDSSHEKWKNDLKTMKAEHRFSFGQFLTRFGYKTAKKTFDWLVLPLMVTYATSFGISTYYDAVRPEYEVEYKPYQPLPEPIHEFFPENFDPNDKNIESIEHGLPTHGLEDAVDREINKRFGHSP